ncbi:MAG: glycosyltransferase [Alistipes sp.]
MNKQRVLLQIGAACNCGAPGKIAEQIGVLAMDNGWDVYMAHGHRHSNPSQLKSIEMATPILERIHALYSILLDKHGLGPNGKTEELVGWIKTNKPDIIHIHNLHGYFINYKTLFEYLSTVNIPIVWTFHDFWSITGHCAYFDNIGCQQWTTACIKCPQNSSYPQTILWHRTSKNYDLKKKLFTGIQRMTIVPVSQWAGTLLKKSFLCNYPIQPIYNGVDTNVFKPRASSVRKILGLETKTILLGVAYPWSERKGYSLYFKLRERLPNEFVIIMVGVNDKERAELPTGIIGIPRTNNQIELAEYYSVADMVLNLSTQETFGMTTVEGMACGTPVVVMNKTASPELVTPTTGVIAEVGDINNIIQAILEIKRNGKDFYSTNCRFRAINMFDKNKCFQKYINLYNQLLIQK